MNNCIKFRRMFDGAFSNELSPDEKEAFDEHLKRCEHCAAEYSEMVSTIEIMKKRELPEPDEKYWDNYWENLSEKIGTVQKSKTVRKRIRNSIIDLFVMRPRLAVYPAAALLLITIGIFLGQSLFSPGKNTVSQKDIEQLNFNQTLLENRIQSYLERSKVILSSLVNFDPVEDDIYTLDMPVQKEISAKLIGEAQYIKSALDFQKQEQLLELVNDLDEILNRIAELDNNISEIEINLLSSAIESSALLLKINIEQIKRSEGNRENKRPVLNTSNS